MIDETVICAVSTPPGVGGIAVIRISGRGCLEMCDKIFVSPSGGHLSGFKANTVHFGEIRDEGELVDEVLATVFRGPCSFTGEDTVEISCHGSSYIQQRLLQTLIRTGARMAQPGEFTRRAFTNGKMDLTQAEAVADLIASSSAAAHKMAMNQMKGGFSGELNKLRDELLRLTALLELELDFSEEDVEFADRGELLAIAGKIEQGLSRLCDSFSLGNVIKNGVPVAIVGNTNVGKSTLLNALLREERAIVSDVEGTTRDSIEDTVNLQGIMFRFIDTAGIRHTGDRVEVMGIERTFKKIGRARIVLLLADAKRGDVAAFLPYYRQVRERMEGEARLLVVLNKADEVEDVDAVMRSFSVALPGEEMIAISAREGNHVEDLERWLVKAVQSNLCNTESVVVSNARHYEALLAAREAIHQAITALNSGLSGEFVAQDTRECAHYLGEITGIITNDATLAFVFKHFCIGK